MFAALASTRIFASPLLAHAVTSTTSGSGKVGEKVSLERVLDHFSDPVESKMDARQE